MYRTLTGLSKNVYLDSKQVYNKFNKTLWFEHQNSISRLKAYAPRCSHAVRWNTIIIVEDRESVCYLKEDIV
jgi:hypothetical protein